MARLVLISDNAALSRQVIPQLEERGHVVIPTQGTEPRIREALELHPDLLIMDFGSMPPDAAAVCQRILSRVDVRCCVLALFGLADEEVHMPILVNTAHTLAQKEATPKIKPGSRDYGFMSVDAHRREAVVRGTHIPLTPTETHVLSVLAAKVGHFIGTQELVSEVHGYEVDEREAGDIIRVHIHNLRHKFEKSGVGPPYILSSRGKGYMLERRTLAEGGVAAEEVDEP